MIIGFVLVLVMNGQMAPVSEHIYPNIASCNADKDRLLLRKPGHDFECAEVYREKPKHSLSR